jgi:rSAM-associated Gly-rich repeat protein
LDFTNRTGLLGFLLALSALSAPAATASAMSRTEMPRTDPSASIEARLSRITLALRERERLLGDVHGPASEALISYGFANGSRGGGFANTRYGGAAVGPGGGGFANGHPYYGGGARGFVNGGGGFVNGSYGGGFVNAPVRGGVFRNW